jgi:poly-gamma-glutamate capsule biosynthesis protein CapA/YwtB (metallophosphatase superfamily)
MMRWIGAFLGVLAAVASAPGGELSDSAAAPPLVMCFGGDVLLGGYYETAMVNDVTGAFRGLDLLRNADIAMVNLENPITQRGKRVEKPYNFRMKKRFVAALKEGGIDLVNIANNHIYDFGAEGLYDTIAELDSAGILHVGAGKTRAAAHEPVILRRKGRSIGFLAYYGGGEAPAAGLRSPGVARRVLRDVLADIRDLRLKGKVDYIVINLHWGTEKSRFPDEGQKAFARALIDGGADAVVGHHPHVLQGIESYHNGIIAYSLGNFIFGGNGRSTYDTGLLRITVSPGEASWEFLPVRVDNWCAAPLHGDDSSRVAGNMVMLSRYLMP